MTKFLKKNILIILILILALFLRFYKLGSFPALNADEAAIGYNAFSLLETGMDEHGNPWPIHFQSFNDFKPGLYFYMVMPFVKLLGLTELAVRIPNALLSSLTVLYIFGLTKIFFRENKNRVAELSALFLAISPWHIHFSRGGWEVGVSTFFITAGIYHLLNNFEYKKSRDLFLSVFFFVCSLYAYHAARVIAPILFFSVALLYKSVILRNLKIFVFAAFFGILLLMPLAKDLMTGEVLSRAAGVGLFADPGPINRINEQRGEHTIITSLTAKVLHNRPINYGLSFLANWASHYYGEFLFLTGDSIERNKVPETGQMYLFDIIFLAIGFAGLLKTRPDKRSYIILIWLVLAPLAAALTFQAPHALRAQNMAVPLVILSALGLTTLLSILKDFEKGRYLKAAVAVLTILILWNFSRYQHMYWKHMQQTFPFSSQYGVKELVQYIEDEGQKYETVVVTEKYDQPYILFLFYLKYPPKDFQFRHSLTSRDIYGFSTVREFGKYKFGVIDFESLKTSTPKGLIAGAPDEIPEATNIVKKIYGSNSFLYFEAVAN
jgi:4-amino-4-deoxy-L-arabinose transferase-like glycosyltransferase